MTDYYKTDKEVLKEAQEEVEKYNKLKNRIKEETKRHRTLKQISKEEEYKLAHSMIADCLEELGQEV